MNDNELINSLKGLNLPTHVGLILDGNRRWAREHKIRFLLGHSAGFKVIKNILRFGVKAGIKYLSVYTFSIENLKRAKYEVKHLFSLLKRGLRDLRTDEVLIEHKTKIKVIGRTNLLPENLKEEIKKAEESTKKYNEHTINFCIAYNGQDEIVDAVKKIIDNDTSSSVITRETIKNCLYTRESPEADLIIRTGMENASRISGFLLWDASYAELKFRKEYWPEYTKEMFVEDLKEYAERPRRFGK